MHLAFAQCCALVLGIVLAFCALVPAVAHAEVVDTTKTGSITATFLDPDTGKAVAGGEVEIYQVARVQKDNADLSFVFTDAWAGCGVSLGDLTDGELANKLFAAKPAGATALGKATAGSDGVVRFNGLELGVYLVVQTQAATGYKSIEPFVVSVPLQQGESWLYNVDATPKMATLQTETPETPEKPNVPEDAKPYNPMPKTGDPAWWGMVVLGAGLAVLMLGLGVKSRFAGKRA